MKFGLHVPNFGDYQDIGAIAALARDAEAAGWDGFFLWDHVNYGSTTHYPTIDPWIALAAIAVGTQRIRLGPLVTPLARRRPWKLARETVSLDHLSGGRVVLGVGLGAPAVAEYSNFGEEANARVRAEKLDEGLAVLVGLWSGKVFKFSGKHYRLKPTRFLPRPVQQPRIPIWVGGYWNNGRAPFRRAARWDGVCPDGYKKSPAAVSAILGYIRQHRPENGPFDYVLLADLPQGPPDAVRETVNEWAQAGVTWWIIGSGARPGALQAARRIVEQGPPPQ